MKNRMDGGRERVVRRRGREVETEGGREGGREGERWRKTTDGQHIAVSFLAASLCSVTLTSTLTTNPGSSSEEGIRERGGQGGRRIGGEREKERSRDGERQRGTVCIAL